MKRALLLLALFVAVLAPPSLAQVLDVNIAGTWYREGDRSRPASVSGSGANLVFVNEFGQRARGHVSGPNAVVADDWEGGLVGIITDGGRTIAWANNTNWRRSAPSFAAPNIAGTWYREGDGNRPASVSGSGANLVFVNEFGQSARGHVSGPNAVVADDWEGGLVGIITDNGQTIAWANNTNWKRSAVPNIAGTWYREGDRSRPASVSGSGANLVFVNEFGQSARGHVSGPNSVVADDWEGGLVGIITDGGRTIAWRNNTNWRR